MVRRDAVTRYNWNLSRAWQQAAEVCDVAKLEVETSAEATDIAACAFGLRRRVVEMQLPVYSARSGLIERSCG